jgi:hypothetical protein
VALARKQAQVLLANQGDEYVPFLTQSANAAIDNYTKANKAFQGLLEILKPNTAIMPHTSAAQGSHTNTKHTVTPDDAIKLIRENTKSVIQDDAFLESTFESLGGHLGLPDVNARNQDLSSIGIGKKASTGLKKPLDSSSKSTQMGQEGFSTRVPVEPIGPSSRPLRDASPGLITDATSQDFLT